MSNAEYIWNFLWERIGNPYGVAGLMGNLCAESGLKANNLQNSYESLLGMNDDEYTLAVDSGKYSKDSFMHDSAGYGLAQWTYWTRKKDLYEFAKESGKSIGDLDMQLLFLWREIGTYRSVATTLFNAKSVREASDAVMVEYEKPADLSEDNKAQRAEYGQMYFERYSDGIQRVNEKAERIVDLAKEHIGCKYVFGATGQIRDGKRVFDCRGFTYWLLKQVGVDISSVGATTQYNTTKDWVERGLTSDMPNLVCPVFKWKEDERKMSHTGMHIGDGVILHCTTKGGVKYGNLSDKTWTHYAIPKGLYSNEEIEAARAKKIMRTLKSGCSGKDVEELQERLNSLGYSCGTVDGVFGSRTKLAVMAFQNDHGLKNDGIVGEKTRAALEASNTDADTGSDPVDEEKTDADMVWIPKKLARELFSCLAPQLDNIVMDCRSETLTQIDYK